MSIFAKESPFYSKLSESRVQCGICPRSCLLNPGERSYCGLYVNVDGKLFNEEFGAVLALFPACYGNWFFHPNQTLLTVQLPNCNSRCLHCWYAKNYSGKRIQNVKPYNKNNPFITVAPKQNSENAPFDVAAPLAYRRVSPSQAGNIMVESGCRGFHFAVLECAISLDWVSEAAQLCHDFGGVNLLSTNGLLSPATVETLSRNIDAVRLSFKTSGDPEFYRTNASIDSRFVFENAKAWKENDVFLQVINSFEVGQPLDTFRSWCRWVVENLGPDTPTCANPLEPIVFGDAKNYFSCIEQIAREEGLRFFKLDLPKTFGDSDSRMQKMLCWLCPNCRSPILTTTFRYFDAGVFVDLLETSDSSFPLASQEDELGVDSEGKCLNCGCQTPIKP